MQRGQGIGNLLGSLFKSFIPVASKIGRSILGSPITKSVLRGARDAALEGGLNVATDALRGADVNRSIEKNLEGARNSVAGAVDRGRKRKKHGAYKKPAKRARPSGARRVRRSRRRDLLSSDGSEND